MMGDYLYSDLVQVTQDPGDLDSGGTWFVTQTFEGAFQGFQFAKRQLLNDVALDVSFVAPQLGSWTTSMSRNEYVNAVQSIRQDIARGWVYQVNLCRVLSTSVGDDFDVIGLYMKLVADNPAPHSSAVYIPAADNSGYEVAIASASPELFLARAGQVVTTSPIKGTASQSEHMLAKDSAENIMIVDLMRNDLSQICEPGSVTVPELLRTEQHPGLVHLVSDVSGVLRDDIGWSHIFSYLCPPGSVSGAPKSSALEVISRLEPHTRGIYCGVLGVVDGDRHTAQLAVGIRTFWLSSDGEYRQLNFGTGAGITWGSDPELEWQETELKAHRLLRIASEVS